MRHNVYGKKLGRTSNERTALFKNLVRSLILHQKIETTEAKAKAIKGLIDKIITQAKSPITKRLVSQFFSDKSIEEKLTKDVLPRLGSRTSGFTTVTKIGKRLGDGSMMVLMSLLLEESGKEIKNQKSKGKSQKRNSKIKSRRERKRLVSRVWRLVTL